MNSLHRALLLALSSTAATACAPGPGARSSTAQLPTAASATQGPGATGTTRPVRDRRAPRTAPGPTVGGSGPAIPPTLGRLVGFHSGWKSPGFLMELEPETGRTKRVDPNTRAALADPTAIHALPDGTLVIARELSRELVTYDPATGTSEHLLPTQLVFIDDLTSRDGVIHAVGRFGSGFENELYRITPDGTELVADLPWPDATGLAYDSREDHFYVSRDRGLSFGELLATVELDGTVSNVIDETNGINVNWDAMAYDPTTLTLWVDSPNQYSRIDPLTGAKLGMTADSGDGVAWDPALNRLYSYEDGGDTTSSYLLWSNPGVATPTEYRMLDLRGVEHLTQVDGTTWLATLDVPTPVRVVEVRADGRTIERFEPIETESVFSVAYAPSLSTAFAATNDGPALYGATAPFENPILQGPLPFSISRLHADPLAGGLVALSGSAVLALDPMTTSVTQLGTLPVADLGTARGPGRGFMDVLSNNTVSRFRLPSLLEVNANAARFHPALGDLTGLARNVETGLLSTVSEETAWLVGTDETGRLVAPHGMPLHFANAVAADPRDGRLFVIADDFLYEVLDGRVFEQVGEQPYLAKGATFHTGLERIIASADNSLEVIDPVDGDRQFVQLDADYSLWGMAYDVEFDALYSVDLADDVLVRIDPTTGATTVVGPLGFGAVRCIAIDQGDGSLYGFDGTLRVPLLIDKSSGAAVQIGPSGFAPEDFTWLPE